MDCEKIGDSFYHQANKTLNKFNWWIIGPTQEEREKDAIESFINAGNQYKLGKCYKKAGEAYYKTASLYCNQSQYYYAYSYYIESANMYKYIDKLLTEDCLRMAIKLAHDSGRFDNAGYCNEQLAELYDKLDERLNLYYKACEYYEASSSKHPLLKCMEKISDVLIKMGKYEEALNILNKLCQKHTAYYACFNYFLSINIINLYLGDLVECRKTLNNQIKKYSNYVNEKNCQMYNNLLIYYEQNNYEHFENCIKDFIKLQYWQEDLLIIIVNRLKNNEYDMT